MLDSFFGFNNSNTIFRSAYFVELFSVRGSSALGFWSARLNIPYMHLIASILLSEASGQRLPATNPPAPAKEHLKN